MTPFMSIDHSMACNGMPSFFSQNFLHQMQNLDEDDEEHRHHHHHHQHPQPLKVTAAAAAVGKRSMSFSGMNDAYEEMNDELSDDCSPTGEKKRRLNMEQVRTLEKNFELGNKLEPERKMQLARALGLQPRQIAIWFQNRRARWKTKQLEKDYDLLRRQFEALKSENEALQSQNKKLLAEISGMKGREKKQEPINLNKETEGSCSNRSENSSDENPLSATAAAAIQSGLNHHHLHEVRPAIFTAEAVPPMRQMALSMKMEPPGSSATEENFCTMFCTMDDQQPFWVWPDHNSFH